MTTSVEKGAPVKVEGVTLVRCPEAEAPRALFIAPVGLQRGDVVTLQAIFGSHLPFIPVTVLRGDKVIWSGMEEAENPLILSEVEAYGQSHGVSSLDAAFAVVSRREVARKSK